MCKTKDFFMLLLYNRKNLRTAQSFMAGNNYVNIGISISFTL